MVLLICLVILGGSTGYYFLFADEASFMDCVYMTVISLTTVGYRSEERRVGKEC